MPESPQYVKSEIFQLPSGRETQECVLGERRGSRLGFAVDVKDLPSGPADSFGTGR